MTLTAQPPQLTLAEFLPIVDTVVSQMSHRLPPHVSVQDLASVGKIALIEAMMNTCGVVPEQFRAYCYTRVRGAVLDDLRRLDPLSRHARAQVKLIARTVAALEVNLGRAPTVDELTAATGLTAESIRQINELAVAAIPVPLGEEQAGISVLALEDTSAPSPAQSAETADLSTVLRVALERLPQKQAYVLQRFYLEDASSDEIAEELGVSLPRIHQLRTAGEKRLKSDLAVLTLWESLMG
ncbi:MAG: sigma-70 family RNA polymerase sigma factor [Opitutus sp.]|nr:sigma-70 family RNA polymerase sigma factor [Opitutus sp.]